jgi:protein-S-isoprenylcysteine O-methyltransferase Ste14
MTEAAGRLVSGLAADDCADAEDADDMVWMICDRTSPILYQLYSPPVRLGGWLFRHRTSLPLPIAFALLLVPSSETPRSLVWLGVGAVLLGEALRLWAVRHIGAISRTRSDRLGPLVDSGPFAIVRNPLYLGNIALWAGFSLVARVPWLAPLVIAVLAIEYHLIVKWEEELLQSRIGDAYRSYMNRVPRWLPKGGSHQATSASHSSGFSLAETLFSERGTLIAIAAGFVLLLFKP